MLHFDMSIADMCRISVYLAGGGVAYGLSSIQLVTGKATTNAIAFITLVYPVIIFGAPSEFGVAFLIWMGFLYTINAAIRLLEIVPVAFCRSGGAPANQGRRKYWQ